jgi:hypothetical protein
MLILEQGTADLVSNITTTVLRANFDLGLNQVCIISSSSFLGDCYIILLTMVQTKWINVTNITTTATPMPTVNLTETGIDDYYLDVRLRSSHPFSTSLTIPSTSTQSPTSRPPS